MKRKNFLILLAAGCLFSCQQQDELQETSKEATNFSISIDDALSDPLTRTSNDLFPARNSITTGEVISMAASGQDYTPFIVGKDSRAWNDILGPVGLMLIEDLVEEYWKNGNNTCNKRNNCDKISE